MAPKSLCGSTASPASGALHPRVDFLDSGQRTESALQTKEFSSRVHTYSRHFKAHSAIQFYKTDCHYEINEPCFIGLYPNWQREWSQTPFSEGSNPLRPTIFNDIFKACTAILIH